MKVCSNCGARIYIDSQKCTVCGAPLIEVPQQNQQEQQKSSNSKRRSKSTGTAKPTSSK